MRLFYSRYHEDGRLLATGEHLLLHVSQEIRQTMPSSDYMVTVLSQIASLHSDLLCSEGFGKEIA